MFPVDNLEKESDKLFSDLENEIIEDLKTGTGMGYCHPENVEKTAKSLVDTIRVKIIKPYTSESILEIKRKIHNFKACAFYDREYKLKEENLK